MTSQAMKAWLWLALFRLIITLTLGYVLAQFIQEKFANLANIISGIY